MNSQSATAKEVTVQHRRHKVYFVRHGVAQHNLSHNSKKDARYTDSKLVGRGQKQASHVGKLLYREFVERQPHQHQRLARIYVSPLTRCLQTASFIFQSLWQQESASGAQRQCIVHPIQVTCREELREAYGVYFSDKRILKSQLQAAWSRVTFPSQMSEEDVLWSPTERETRHSIERRIDMFLQHLARDLLDSDAGSSTLVVSHGVLLEVLFYKYCPYILDGGRRVHNCDLFEATVCVSSWIDEKRKCSVHIQIEECHCVTP